jgi:hypothetical protein
MLAHHPLTGKPIRILKTETHVYKNQKTLAWLQNDPSGYGFAAPRFSRWDTLVTSHQRATVWKETLGGYPSAIVLTTPSESLNDWLSTKAPKEQQILFLSRAVMSAYGKERFTEEKFQNVLCLEELSGLFPQTGRTYNTDESLHHTVLLIASVFRVKRVCGFTADELADPLFQTEALRLATRFGLETHLYLVPESLILIQQFYKPKKPRREREIRKCLEENLKCPYVDTILLLNEEKLIDSLPSSSKLVERVIGHRLTYADVIQEIKTNIPSNTIVVFANSDIYLTPTWRDIWSIDLKDVFLSLLRWEEPTEPNAEPELFGPRPDSQDTWVLYSSSVKEREWDYTTLDFPFGKSGCDNAINVELMRKKFKVANPALSLKTMHCHSSQFRTYDPKDVVDKPFFLYLDPTGLHDLEPKFDTTTYKKPFPEATSFTRKVQSWDQRDAKTFCRMVSRQQQIELEYASDNVFTPQPEEALYTFRNAFTTPNGLPYGYSTIYLGQNQTVREQWANTQCSHLTPCIGVEKVATTLLTDETANSCFKYIQNYVAKILRMKDAGYKGDMWMGRSVPRLHDFLQRFNWEEKILPVLPREPDVASYSSTVHFLTPREKDLVYKEEIEVLRTHFPGYQRVPSTTNPKRIVICQDDTILTSDDTLALEAALEADGYEVDILYPSRSSATYMLQRILGAPYVITSPGCEEFFWMLPEGAKVIDIQSELEIKGAGVHTAGAASLSYWILLMARMNAKTRTRILVERVQKTLKQMANPISQLPTLPPADPSSPKPLLILPKDFEGFHGHSGDSFREMARMWAERGYVELQFSGETPYCWLGGIGKVLLYDRANFDWIQQTPADYKAILCGNPDASKIPKGIQWSFWPRRPRMLEDKASQPRKNYAERTKEMVFYGLIENHVQKEHRLNKLWEACDDFCCPVRTNGAHQYSQQEYLQKLSVAKFGLCMAGFGPKCNREIECMALGTVPVVAPDVDMENYAVKPIEGVHYIRLASFDPEEAKARIAQISEAQWEQMSEAATKWWRSCASVDGLWETTKRLVEWQNFFSEP